MIRAALMNLGNGLCERGGIDESECGDHYERGEPRTAGGCAASGDAGLCKASSPGFSATSYILLKQS
jgi:hypothetical protein